MINICERQVFFTKLIKTDLTKKGNLDVHLLKICVIFNCDQKVLFLKNKQTRISHFIYPKNVCEILGTAT